MVGAGGAVVAMVAGDVGTSVEAAVVSIRIGWSVTRISPTSPALNSLVITEVT